MTGAKRNAGPAVRAYQGVAVLFFILMLVIPTTYQTARGVILLFLIGGGILAYAQGKKLHLHRVIVFWLFLTVLTSLTFIFVGLVNGAPGALEVATVFVIWPIVFVFLIGLARHPVSLIPYLRAIIIGSLGASIAGALLVADSLFGFGLGLENLLQLQGAIVGLYDGAIEYRLFNLTTVLYSLVFLMAALQIPRHLSIFEGRWRFMAWVALGLSVIILLISGRRAFWLIAALSPLIVYGIARLGGVPIRFFSTYLKIIILGFLLFLAAIPYLRIDILMLYESFMQGFDFSGQGGYSSSIRAEQFWLLLNAWSEKPLLGHGHGAYISELVRDPDQPWAYELSYIALLFQTGILGMLVYSSAVLWVFVKGVFIMRQQPESVGYLFPVLAALAAFLLANATNPYLQKFDYLWVIFLPVAVINIFILRKTP